MTAIQERESEYENGVQDRYRERSEREMVAGEERERVMRRQQTLERCVRQRNGGVIHERRYRQVYRWR